jgi:hypothetical protein
VLHEKIHIILEKLTDYWHDVLLDYRTVKSKLHPWMAHDFFQKVDPTFSNINMVVCMLEMTKLCVLIFILIFTQRNGDALVTAMNEKTIDVHQNQKRRILLVDIGFKR